MAGIPQSAIKFYTAASGGTEVTGGTNAGATIYTRVIAPFTEDLTGSNKTVTLPFNGRIALSGLKTFSCPPDSDAFTANLPEGGTIYAAADKSVGWSGIGTADYEVSGGNPDYIHIPKGAGQISLTWYSNIQYLTGDASGHNGASYVSHVMNGVNVGEEPANAITVNDIGRVGIYPVVLTYNITENPTIAERTVLIYNYSTIGTTINFVQAAGDANLTLSVSSANVDNTTGLSSTPITVNANTNWTIL